MRIRPAARYQLSVPAQNGRRRHEERSPQAPRQHPAERAKQRPISLAQPRTGHLTFEYPDLMAQHQYLDLLLALRPRPQHDELQQAAQRPVEKRHSHALRTTRHRR